MNPFKIMCTLLDFFGVRSNKNEVLSLKIEQIKDREAEIKAFCVRLEITGIPVSVRTWWAGPGGFLAVGLGPLTCLQVLVQPANEVVQAPLSHTGHHGQEGEHHAAMESVLVVVAGCRDARLLQPPDIHQAVVPQHVKLTGHHIRCGRASQNRLVRQQRRRPHVHQLGDSVHHPGRASGSDHGLEVLPSICWQQGGPVHLGAGLSTENQLVQRTVVVGKEEGLQSRVNAQVLQPEPGHERPVEDGHGLVLLVGRRVEVQRL